MPEPAPACNPNTRTRRADLKQWLDDLPHANPMRVCRELRGQLELLARYPDTIARFEQLLEPVAPIVTDLVHIMLRRPSSAFGDTSLEQVLEQDLLPMLTEYAHVCKRAINERIEQDGAPGPGLLFNCAEALSLVMLIESLTYRGMASQGWRELLQVHEMAEATGHSEERHGNEAALHGARSVHDCFFGTLLTQLADPLHLSSPQTWDLFTIANEYAHLLDFDGEPGGGWCIAIDTSGTVPPLNAVRRGASDPDAVVRWLNLGALVTALDQAENPEQTQPLLDAVQQIVASAGIGEGRRLPRVATEAPYSAYQGLSQIATRLRSLAEPPSAPVAGEEPPAAPTPVATPTPCTQFNQSQGGAAFRFAADLRHYPRVNDLMLFEGTNEHGRLVGYAAVVRRRRQRDDGEVEIGVERLAGNFTPMTMLDPPDALKGRDLPAALIRHSPQLEGLELLAPTGTHGSRAVFNLSGPSSKHKLQLLALNGTLNGIEMIRVARDEE